jgi:hypothetical protein
MQPCGQFRVFFYKQMDNAEAMTRTKHRRSRRGLHRGWQNHLRPISANPSGTGTFRKNPFLEEFYLEPARNAFETESQFFLLHYHQLKAVYHSAQGETITDFKDLVFANTNIAEPAEEDDVPERGRSIAHCEDVRPGRSPKRPGRFPSN